MATLCDGCEFLPYEAIRQFSNNTEEALIFLRNHGVLPSEVTCPRCSKACGLRSDRHTWRCYGTYRKPKTKKRFQCTFSVSDYNGTFLEQCHFEPWKIILYVNAWLQKSPTHLDLTRNVNFSSEATVRWRKLCAIVTEYVADNQPPIGGPGVSVEIDRQKFGNASTLNPNGEGTCGVWVFGGIERVSRRFFVVPLIENPYPDRDTLIPLIKKYIRPGSVIESDDYFSYMRLSDYQHHTVNPKNPEIHTQNIKLFWKDIKSYILKAGTLKKYYKQYISRYIFIKSVPNQKELLHHFFRIAAQLYPPFGQATEPGPSWTSPSVGPIFTPDVDSSGFMKHADSDVEVSEEDELSPDDSNPAIADDCQPALQAKTEHVTPAKKRRECGGSTTDQVLSVKENKLASICEEVQCDSFIRSLAASLRDLPEEMKFHAQRLISDVIFHAEIGKLDETSQVCTTLTAHALTGEVEYHPQITNLTRQDPSSF